MVDIFYYKFIDDGITAIFFGKDKINHIVCHCGDIINFSDSIHYNLRNAHLRELKIPYSRWIKLIKNKLLYAEC